MLKPQPLEVLITVKTYPNPSAKHGETSCVAGIGRDGNFVRLYPVPFRDMEDDRKFTKYQWIRCNAFKAKHDSRPESFRADWESIEVLNQKPLSTEKGWAERKKIIFPSASPSLCRIVEEQAGSGKSLGLFRPAEVLDFMSEPDPVPDWSEGDKAKLAQSDLFHQGNKNRPLKKVPFKFRYKFRCADCKAKEPHEISIVDWELGWMFLRERRAACSIEDCLKKIKDKWLGELCSTDKDTYFFVGNQMAHPQSFLILGVFWPPKEQETSQLPLL